MSTPLHLSVAAPTVAFKAVAERFAPLEDLVTLSFSPVRFPDGSPMTADNFVGAHGLLSRNVSATSTPEVWDQAAKIWRAASSVDLRALTGIPIIPPKSVAAPWQGMLIGASQKDSTGAAMIVSAVDHFPQYRVRGAFRAKRKGIDAFGLGPDSAPLEFASAASAARFAAELMPDADGATRVRILLRNGSAQPSGYLEIDASGGAAVITISNFDAFGSALASIRLEGDGAIRLVPGNSKKVIIAGDLEAEHIRYLPTTGPVKKELN